MIILSTQPKKNIHHVPQNVLNFFMQMSKTYLLHYIFINNSQNRKQVYKSKNVKLLK